MRKKCTRLVSLALVLAMLVSMMMPAFADELAGAGETLPRDGLAAGETAGEPEDEELPAGLPEDEQENEPEDELEDKPAEGEAAVAPAEPASEAALEAGEAAAEEPAAEESGIALLAETEAGNDGFTKGKEEGSNYCWKLEDGTLTIKGTVMANWDYVYTQAPWYADRDVIQNLVIEEGVINIGSCAFLDCSGLTGVLTIPEGVTSIGIEAFRGCSGLTRITIPKSVTSIDGYAFSGCSSLGDILFFGNAPEMTTETFLGLWGAVAYYPQNDATWTEEARPSYYGGWVSYDPANPPQMVSYQWNLNEDGTLTIKGTKMPENWSFHGAPWYERGYKRVVIEDGMTNIGTYAFFYSTSLTSVTIPESVTSIGDSAFGSTPSLTSITIPESVTSIGEEAFINSGLTSITIPSSVTSIGDGAFYRCMNLKEISLSAKNTSYCLVDGILYSKDRTRLLRAPTGKTGAVNIPSSMTSFDSGAFSGCSGLTSITIPEGITCIGDETFSGCSGLTSITIPAGVTNIGLAAFEGCESLNEILFKEDAPQFDEDAPEFEGEGIPSLTFYGVIATAYYPQNNATWTEAVRKNYGGTITWVPYDPANPPSMEPDDPAAPEDPEQPEDPDDPEDAEPPTDPENPEKPEDPKDSEEPTDPEKPTDPTPGAPNTWKDTDQGVQYIGADGEPLTGSNWIEELGHRYVFDKNGSLQTGNAAGDLIWNGNQYYLNPDRDPNDPTTCYCVTNYRRHRPGIGDTYYNQDGITYRGWVESGGKLLYQTVLRGEDGRDLKDADGFSTYIFVWGVQQIPASPDPLDPEETIAAGTYLFDESGMVVTGRTGWYNIPGSSAIAGEYYLTGTDGQCALNTTRWDNAKGHRYLFGADGRKVSAGKDGLDVALTINGQYQTLYLEPNMDYVACNYYRPRQDSKGGDLGLTYYNQDGITYRGWVDGGSGKRLYQTVMNIQGVGELYFIVWRAQYLPAGKDPVTKDPIPAGWYLFDDNGVLITEDGVYTYPDTKGVDHRYQVKDGKIVAIDGKAPAAPGGK